MNKKSQTVVSLPIFITSLLIAILVTAAIAIPITYVSRGAKDKNATFGTEDPEKNASVGKLSLIDSLFREYSLYDLDGELLVDEMLKAYAEATKDRYAAYYTDEEYERVKASNRAETVGIGITVIEDDTAGGARIVSVVPSSPAAEAGILVDDILVSVNTEEGSLRYQDIGFDALLRQMRGEVGSTASFSVLRNGEARAFSVVREKVNTISVEGRVYALDATVGILRLSKFDLSTPVQLTAEFDKLKNAGCTSFVFDVRGNPGGDLRSVTTVLSYFLEEGDLMLTTLKKNGAAKEYRVEVTDYDGDYAACNVSEVDIGKYREEKLTVLVNGNTASAAELFAAALHDHGKAKIVGTQTFGKGIIQNTYSLAPYGYSGAIKLTTGFYSPPSGENYDGKGLTPDVVVEPAADAVGKNPYTLEESEDLQLQKAVAELKK